MKPQIDFPKKMTHISRHLTERIIKIAIEEDLDGVGDITTLSLFSNVRHTVTARIIAKENGIVCGIPIAEKVFSMTSGELDFKAQKDDGDAVKAGETLIILTGNPSAITTGERIALNFMGMMSGVASKVHRLTQNLKGTSLRLLDTRKTLPGLREFQKYAVHKGGGYNHRIGLYDMFLIKENHIRAVGSIQQAVKKAKTAYPAIPIEIEVEDLSEVRQALETQADIIMLDNMSNEEIQEAVTLIGDQKWIEASGNVTKDRLSELAKVGVDFVSMGALTHTVKPLDISLLLDTKE